MLSTLVFSPLSEPLEDDLDDEDAAEQRSPVDFTELDTTGSGSSADAELGVRVEASDGLGSANEVLTGAVSGTATASDAFSSNFSSSA